MNEDNSEDYLTEAWCPFCRKETEQSIHSDGHERDSSWDKETCLECGAYKFGFMREWTRRTPE